MLRYHLTINQKKQRMKERVIHMANQKKKTTIRSEALSDLKEIRKLVKEAIDAGANNVERVHQAIARIPFKYLEKVKRLERVAEDADVVQRKSIKHGYDLLRELVKSMDDITVEILERVEKRTVTA